MIKWFVYIVFLLVCTPCILSAKAKKSRREFATIIFNYADDELAQADTTIKALKSSAKPDSKVKEVAKAKRQPKPEKVESGDAKKTEKPKRQRRPDGMERPPEIPRRNDN